MSTGVDMGTDVDMGTEVDMGTDVIGSRYRVTEVVARTEETTTWDAHDTWLEQPVLVVTPEPRAAARFEDLTASLREQASPHLVGLYDAGPAPAGFAVLQPPAVTLSDEWSPKDEEDVLAAGQSLGDAVAALHGRGIVHGGIHPGTVVLGDGGDVALSPWPLAPEPPGWSGPGGFASDPHEPHGASAAGDVRALGALLLGALAGPPLLSSEQVESFERELATRAPGAVVVTHRALTAPRRGGYWAATELRDDCAATLAGEQLAGEALAEEPLVGEQPASSQVQPRPERPLQATAANRNAAQPDQTRQPDRAAGDPPEGRRMAVAVAVAVALVAGASATGALSGPPPRPDAAAPKACTAHHNCGAASTGGSRGTVGRPAPATAPLDTTPPAGAPAPGASTATFADVSVAGSGAAATTPHAAAPATLPTSTSTTRPASTTSTSSTSSTTSTSTTTSTVPQSTTTTTTTPPSTTSTTSSGGGGIVTAGPTAGEPSGTGTAGPTAGEPSGPVSGG